MAVAATTLGTGSPAGAAPKEGPAEVRARIDGLYAQVERATERFNAADERRRRLREQAGHLQDGFARAQEEVNRMRGSLASLAGAEYRSGGIDRTVALLLSTDPGRYLDRAATLERIGYLEAGRLHALRGAERSLRQQRSATIGKLAELEESRSAVARHKKRVERRLTTARRALHRLTAQQRTDYLTGPHSPRPLPGGGSGAPAASARAAAAVAAARQAVGRPYVWGATGPDSFDCSGLTQWAYGQAGVAIPRTSQAQRNAGRQVPLSQARPGDLVLYRADASHVAMYVGGGQVVHAPRPGAAVRYDPVGMMPISAVTRV